MEDFHILSNNISEELNSIQGSINQNEERINTLEDIYMSGENSADKQQIE